VCVYVRAFVYTRGNVNVDTPPLPNPPLPHTHSHVPTCMYYCYLHHVVCRKREKDARERGREGGGGGGAGGGGEEYLVGGRHGMRVKNMVRV
jgi:hypothetical protein